MYHLALSGLGAVSDYTASMEVIGQLQCALLRAGYDPGGLDGLWGTKSKAAVAALVKAGGGYATLGLNEADVTAAIAYQAAHKTERPAGYIPDAVAKCSGIPGAFVGGGWMGRNWPWLVGGVVAAGVIGTAAYFATRKPSRSMGFTYDNPWARQAGYV